jgi:microcystin-dependent protein
VSQIPAHSHPALATANLASSNSPTNNLPAPNNVFGVSPYGSDAPRTNLIPSSVSPVGGSQPHTNFQPYLCVDFIISLFGIFPSPT